MKIQSKTLFYHSLNPKGFKTEGAATRDYDRILKSQELRDAKVSAKEFRANYCRINATSPKHFKELLESKAKEFWGIELKFTTWNLKYGYCCGSDLRPINGNPNKPRSSGFNKGFSGEISGTCVIPDKLYGGISDFCYSFITGLHLSSGSVGKNFHCFVNLLIDDFPLIVEKQDSYLEYRDKALKERSEFMAHEFKNKKIHDEVCCADSQINDIGIQIAQLTERIQILQNGYETRCDQLHKKHCQPFKINFPMEKCDHLDIFGKF